MKLLALDTATEACSAALYIDGEITQQYEVAPQQHSNLLLPMVDSLISDAGIHQRDLDVIAFGRGPGSFMGVRIATGVAQGMAFALSLPVVPVSSLAAIAKVSYNETGATQVACAIDARMNEVYWACYQVSDDKLPKLLGEEQVLAPEKIEIPENGEWVGAGTGWGSYMDKMKSVSGQNLVSTQPDCLPNAKAIAQLAVIEVENGNTVSADQALPIYLRNNVAKTTAEREQAQQHK